MEVEEGEIIIKSTSPSSTSSSQEYICQEFLSKDICSSQNCRFSHKLKNHPCPQHSLIGKCATRENCPFKHRKVTDPKEQIILIKNHPLPVLKWYEQNKRLKLDKSVAKQLPKLLNDLTSKLQKHEIRPQILHIPTPILQPQMMQQQTRLLTSYPYETLAQQQMYQPLPRPQMLLTDPIFEQFTRVAQHDPSAARVTEFLINTFQSKLQELTDQVLEKIPVIKFLKQCIAQKSISSEDLISLLKREPKPVLIILLLQQIDMNPSEALKNHPDQVARIKEHQIQGHTLKPNFLPYQEYVSQVSRFHQVNYLNGRR